MLAITLKVAHPWHVYANPVGYDELESARTTVEVLADGKKQPVVIDYPKGSVEKDEKGKDYHVYAGNVIIHGTLTAKDIAKLEVKLKVQACTSGANGRCLLPATLSIPVK